MQGSDFIFCFQDKQHRFWQVDATGMITINSKPYFLDFAPDGWNDITIQNVRNKKYWAIDRTVSIPLTYVNDGAHILKHIFYTLGIEESVYLVIAKQEIEYTPGVTYGYWYKQIFRGEIDLSTFLHNGSKITCTTLEDGLAKYLKSNETTTYELPMNVPQAIFVKMDGINLHNKVHYGTAQLQESGSGFEGYNDLATIPLTLTREEGDGYGLAYLTCEAQKISNNGLDDNAYMNRSDNWCIKNDGTIPITFPLDGHIDVKCLLNDDDSLAGLSALFLYFKTSISLTGYIIANNVGMAEGATVAYPFSFSVTLLPGEKLFPFRMFNPINPGARAVIIEYEETSEVLASAITRKPTTYIRAFRGQYLYEQLTEKVTESQYTAALAVYFEKYKQKVFTCGNAIRGLDDAVMKISYSDYFKDWDCFDSVGISEDAGVVGFDTKENLIDTVNVIDLQGPAAGTFKVSVAKDFLFNQADFGYPEIKNEIGVLNGNEEFNCKFSWSVGVTKSPAKLDKVSPIQAGSYPIEKIRITTFAKETTDYKADNDLFSLYIEVGSNPAIGVTPEHYKLDRSLNASATGLIDPLTVFNLPLSPKRNLMRNGPFMSSCMYLANNKVLKYQSSDKNNKVACGGVIENEDVPVSAMGNKFFLPLLLSGDFPAPDNLEVLLDLNPKQLFRFPMDGNIFYGILQKVSVESSKRGVQNYEFLNHILNDTKKLIEYYG